MTKVNARCVLESVVVALFTGSPIPTEHEGTEIAWCFDAGLDTAEVLDSDAHVFEIVADDALQIRHHAPGSGGVAPVATVALRPRAKAAAILVERWEELFHFPYNGELGEVAA